MNQLHQFRALASTGKAIVSLLDGITVDEARWKSQPEKWSLLEILCHLVDEEKDDFRTRLTLTLENPNEPWPATDPEGWVLSRNYLARDLARSLEAFEAERAVSLRWLKRLRDPNWSAEHRHPQFGAIRAGDLVASWLAHDLLHIHQIVNTRLAYVADHVRPFSTRYAEP